jgi:hypothetical protein
MLGRGQPLSSAATPDPNLELWQSGTWQTAADPLGGAGDHHNGIGPGMSFGLTLLQSDPDTTVGLVMCAVDTSPIGDWMTNQDDYRNCLGSAMAASGGKIAGVLFLQGESDAKAHSSAKTWAKSFKAVRAGFARDLGPNVPLLLGQIGQYDPDVYRHQQELRDQQAAEAAANAGTTLVATSDLPVARDGVHFTLASYQTIGARFAAAWLGLGVGSSGGGGGGGSVTTPTQVFVLAGQSNMVGRGKPLSLASTPDPHVELWRDGAWTEAADPLGPAADDNRGIGPGMTFGLTLHGLEPGETIGLVMCARGATSIAEWQPGTPVYQNCISATRAGGAPVAGIVFLQGETDAKKHKAAIAWGEGFQSVLTAFRSDLGNVPFILGQIGQADADIYVAAQEVRDEQATAASTLPGVTLVVTKDLPISKDGIHFTVDSYKTIGSRFVTAWWQASGH